MTELGAELEDPEPCSCEQAERLLERIAQLERDRVAIDLHSAGLIMTLTAERAETARLTGLCSLRDATERENARLSAETARLRERLAQETEKWRRRQDNWRTSSERSLAAANELLGNAEDYLNEWPEPRNQSLRRNIRTFLSAQPAPASVERGEPKP